MSTATSELRSRAWAIVGALSVTETVSWGVLYYAFAVFLVPMEHDLGFSTAQLTGAFSAALLVSGIAGVGVGRYLDRRSPRPLMTVGSIAGVLLVLAWSEVRDLEAFYALWLAIGLVMAAVLYEPAFTVLAKWFPHAAERRRAMTALTLVAALASFVFLPLSQALIDAHGWRHALVILALVLGAITIPLHSAVLRAPDQPPPAHGELNLAGARHALPLGYVLAAVGRLLPGLVVRDSDDRPFDPVPRAARPWHGLRSVRGRPSGSHPALRHHHTAASCAPSATSASAVVSTTGNLRSMPVDRRRRTSRTCVSARARAPRSSSSSELHDRGAASSRANVPAAAATSAAAARSDTSNRRGGRSNPITGAGRCAVCLRRRSGWAMSGTVR